MPDRIMPRGRQPIYCVPMAGHDAFSLGALI
jgi:hypothetical protein